MRRVTTGETIFLPYGKFTWLLEVVKQFYKFSEGRHPLQVIPADIERFYDHVSQKVDRNTAYLNVPFAFALLNSLSFKISLLTAPIWR